MKSLIITNSPKTCREISLCLQVRFQSIENLSANEFSIGINLIRESYPDFVVLDSSLAGMKPEEFTHAVRAFSEITIICLVEDTVEKIALLEAGADECVSKPINYIEFLSTVNALLRRNNLNFKPTSCMKISEDVSVDFDRREVTKSGRQIHLTPTEYRLLSLLAKNKGQILQNQTILEKVWGTDYSSDTMLLKKHIYNLRCKIESNPKVPAILLTERDLGYKLAKQMNA